MNLVLGTDIMCLKIMFETHLGPERNEVKSQLIGQDLLQTLIINKQSEAVYIVHPTGIIK